MCHVQVVMLFPHAFWCKQDMFGRIAPNAADRGKCLLPCINPLSWTCRLDPVILAHSHVLILLMPAFAAAISGLKVLHIGRASLLQLIKV